MLIHLALFLGFLVFVHFTLCAEEGFPAATLSDKTSIQTLPLNHLSELTGTTLNSNEMIIATNFERTIDMYW
jgi:hypothetical protein